MNVRIRTLAIPVALAAGLLGLHLLAPDRGAYAGPRLDPLAAESETAAPGARLYATHCAVCHGAEGAGDGPADYFLRPRPRNFRLGYFRIVSTENGVARKEDILRTLREGMPGTGMPSWEHLPPEQLDALADHVLGLVREGVIDGIVARAAENEEEVTREEAAEWAVDRIEPGPAIDPGEEPAIAAEGIERGRQLFAANCATCHGSDARGIDNPEWVSAEGHPIGSRDLLQGVFKGGRDGEDLYRRLTAGIPGSPMPAFGGLSRQVRWDLVHYVQSLSNPVSQELARIRQHRIRAVHRETLPAGPGDGAWETVPATRVALMPMFQRDAFRDAVLVRAVHDGERIAFLLSWEDATNDTGGLRQTEFPDGCAVQHSDADEAPLFTMGDPEHLVNIWHWKALWSEDTGGIGDVTSIWPNATADAYYGREEGWNAGPRDDPLYRPGRHAGNPMSADERRTPVEDNNAARFGSLTTQPADDQNVDGAARWQGGVWRVQFARDLHSPSARDVTFRPGENGFVAFAVWNGSIGDRDGQKSIGIWNVLEIEP